MEENTRSNLDRIKNYLEERQAEMETFWGMLVNEEGQYEEYENIRKVANLLRISFEAEGLECNLEATGKESPPMLVGILGNERQGKPILFSGHYDTVFKAGHFGKFPFRIEDGRAYGPGVLDMKGGIVIALYIIKALNFIGYDKAPIKIVFVGDEEGSRLQSNAADMLKKEAEGCLFAFNMETGGEDGSVCIGRKGCSEYEIMVKGVSSHPGNAFNKGRNAIEEMCSKILEIQKITPEDRRYTVSVGTINGGTVSNIIPGECTCKVDVRYSTCEDEEYIRKKMEEICGTPYIENTITRCKCTESFSAFEQTKKTEGLHRYLSTLAEEYGQPVPGWTYLGGVSDAANIAKADIPVLCSCGVQGSGNHTEREFAIVRGMAERIQLLCLAVLNKDKFTCQE